MNQFNRSRRRGKDLLDRNASSSSRKNRANRKGWGDADGPPPQPMEPGVPPFSMPSFEAIFRCHDADDDGLLTTAEVFAALDDLARAGVAGIDAWRLPRDETALELDGLDIAEVGQSDRVMMCHIRIWYLNHYA